MVQSARKAVQTSLMEALLLAGVLGANKSGNMDEGKKLLDLGAALSHGRVRLGDRRVLRLAAARVRGVQTT